MSIKDNYDEGECPDCGDPIPDDMVDGGECANCGHVFCENDEGPSDWEALPQQAKEDLTQWFNAVVVDDDDKILLAQLYIRGNFHAWNCPTCGERVYWGDPEDWDNFQGVCQADFTSYPGSTDYYTLRIVTQQCDSCRMNCPTVHNTDVCGIGEPGCWSEE